MIETISHIKKIQIEKLWGQFDIVWELQSDVNILSGINGSGKSTILKLIYDALISSPIDCIYKRYQIDSEDGFLAYGDNIPKDIDIAFKDLGIFNSKKRVEPKNLFVSFIQTFDSMIEDNQGSFKPKRTLDLKLNQLQIDYRDFQLNLNKIQKKLITENVSIEEQNKIYNSWDYFLNTLDKLFEKTGKKIDREKNELSFLIGDLPLSVYNLSAGEKQLVLILITALIQENKPSIFILDEPEISLHTDWQHSLIEILLTLNPNAQLIIATHSPSLIMNGWMDKITTMDEITQKSI